MAILSGGTQGTANNAWTWPVYADPNDPRSPVIATNGRYGMNGWLYKWNASTMSTSSGGWINPSDAGNFFPRDSAVRHPSQTPEFVDALWPDHWPYQLNQPDQNGVWELYAGASRVAQKVPAFQGMARCCISRHGSKPPASGTYNALDSVRPLPGSVNLSFVDGHAEYARLDKLWLYYWNNTANPVARP